jgi:hypothetical protein
MSHLIRCKTANATHLFGINVLQQVHQVRLLVQLDNLCLHVCAVHHQSLVLLGPCFHTVDGSLSGRHWCCWLPSRCWLLVVVAKQSAHPVVLVVVVVAVENEVRKKKKKKKKKKKDFSEALLRTQEAAEAVLLSSLVEEYRCIAGCALRTLCTCISKWLCICRSNDARCPPSDDQCNVLPKNSSNTQTQSKFFIQSSRI